MRNALSHWGNTYVKGEKEGDWGKMRRRGIRLRLFDPCPGLL